MSNSTKFRTNDASSTGHDNGSAHRKNLFEIGVEPDELGPSEGYLGCRAAAIRHIEKLILSYLTQLSASFSPPATAWVTGSSRPSKPKKIEIRLADRRKSRPDGSFGVRSICYPRNSKGPSAKPLAQLFRVLALIHEGLVNNIPSTKRDMFYNDVALFQSQAVVDRLVDDLAATFNLKRSDLNVRATSKGIVCGAGLAIHLLAGETVRVNDSEGTLIPSGENISHFEVDDDVAWVLIVEKDAVFQTLCQLKLASHRSICGRGLIITGKGYPDMATRQLVKALSENLPLSVPILVLVDGDPYGVEILMVYKHGSQSLKHENEKLAAERVEWLGIWASELAGLDIDRNALIPISRHDEKKAISMLCRPSSALPMRWRKELMHMLHTRRKAEIEILTSSNLTQQASFASTLNHPQEQMNVDLFYPPAHAQERQTYSHMPTSTSLLLRYLRDKISGFVVSHS